MVSWQAKAFKKFIILSGKKNKFLTKEAMTDYVKLMEKRPPYKLNPKYMKKHQIGLFQVGEMDVYVLNQHSITSKAIIYFHGGAYVNEPLSFHWRYLVKLAEKTKHKIYVPIYPKLPHHAHVECYKRLDLFYEKIIEPMQTTFDFMGDSAGGGLAIAFSQKLRDEFKRTPQNLILFSPWLDIDGEYEGYEELEKLDPMVAIPGAKRLGQLWMQPSHAKNPLVSPIYGPLDEIGELTVIVGTHELILFDCRRLKERADSEQIPIRYYEFEEMNHVFPVFPIPEAKQVWPIILPILLNEQPVSAPSLEGHPLH